MLCFFAIALSGCAAIGQKSSPIWPWREGDKVKNPCESDCTDKEALNAYLQAHEFCRQVHNYYESRDNRAGFSQLIVGTVGTLAGAVIAPISSGGAARAWSGLSGATNALQTSIEDNFSGQIASKRRAAVQDATKEGGSKYATSLAATDKVIASINMAAACAMAPSKADTSVFKALGDSTTTNATDINNDENAAGK